MALTQNQFGQLPVLGLVAMAVAKGTVSAVIDSTESGTLVPGQAVKITSTSGDVPKVVACSADADEVYGFINYDGRHTGFVKGDAVELSQAGNDMYLQANGAIASGAQVQLNYIVAGSVTTKTGGGADIVGYAIDTAADLDIFRVHLTVPSYAKA